MFKKAMCVAVAALTIGWMAGLLKADNAPSGATLTGHVLDQDGNPLANARVAVVNGRQGKAAATTNPSATATTGKHAKGQKTKGQRPAPVATGTTDANGAFTITGIPEGSYMVVAGGRGTGHGRARVTLSAGQSTDTTVSIQQKGSKGAAKLGLHSTATTQP